MSNATETVSYGDSSSSDGLPALNVKPMVIFIALMLLGSAGSKLLKRAECISQQRKIVCDVASMALIWFATSTWLSNYNKWIYFYAMDGFNYPLSVTAWHMFLKGVLAFLYLLAAGSEKSLVFDKAMLISAIPVGLATGLDICLTNQAVAGFIDLGLVTIVKSSTLVFTYVLSLIMKVQPPNLSLTFSVFIIVCGILTALVGDRLNEASGSDDGGTDHATKTAIGVLMAAGAALCGSIRWVATELVMKPSAGSALSDTSKMEMRFKVLMYISPAATVVSAILAGAVEGATITHDERWSSFSDSIIIALIVSFGGVAAIGLLFAELALVQIASALTLAITGHAKDVMTIILGVLVFSEVFTVFKGAGMLIIFTGGVFYMNAKAKLLRERDTSNEQQQEGSSDPTRSHPLRQDGRVYNVLNENESLEDDTQGGNDSTSIEEV